MPAKPQRCRWLSRLGKTLDRDIYVFGEGKTASPEARRRGLGCAYMLFGAMAIFWPITLAILWTYAGFAGRLFMTMVELYANYMAILAAFAYARRKTYPRLRPTPAGCAGGGLPA